MWPYWVLFLIPALAAIQQPTQPRPQWHSKGPVDRGKWFLVVGAMTLMIGLRHEVGGDWENYLEHSFSAAGMTFEDAVLRSDPAYWVVTWLTADLSWSIYAANLVFALIFSTGLVLFCRAQPRPWLALAVAVPYMVIVLGMGYTRQGVALGLAMIGLVALGRQKTLQFVLWVAAGALFHKSAVILIPLGVLATPRRRVWTAFWIGVAACALYNALLSDSIDALSANYVQAEYQSEGALIRVMMNVLPALTFLWWRRRLTLSVTERNLWTWISIMALSCAAALAISPSSTAVDRIALYVIPLQLFVFSRMPDFVASPRSRRLSVALIVVGYAAVLFVWLMYAVHSQSWLPYRLMPAGA